MHGVSANGRYYEGYLEFKAEMLRIDPTITLAPVSNDPASNYGNWGAKIISNVWGAGEPGRYQGAGFYDVHGYPYDNLPATVEAVLRRPQTYWPGMMANIRADFAALAPGAPLPDVGVTEYNIISDHERDSQQLMTHGVNLLFMADSLGAMMQAGFKIGAGWAMANGRANSGSEYGLLWIDQGYKRAPQYFAFRLWSLFGNTILPTANNWRADTQLSAYGGRAADGTVTLLVINKQASATNSTIHLNGSPIYAVVAHEARCTTLLTQDTLFNGVPEANLDDALSAPPRVVPMAAFADGLRLHYEFPPYSATMLLLTTSTAATSSTTTTAAVPTTTRPATESTTSPSTSTSTSAPCTCTCP